jgi:hypothetical protein
LPNVPGGHPPIRESGAGGRFRLPPIAVIVAGPVGHWGASARDRNLLRPHLVRQFHDHAQLGPLLLLGEHIALFRGRKAALRRQTKLIKRYVLVASSMRRLISSFGSSCPLLEVTRPRTTCFLSFGRTRNGSKPPARSVSNSRKARRLGPFSAVPPHWLLRFRTIQT